MTGAGNIISANHTRGIWLTNASWNLLQGNLIGTKADGLSGLGNTFHSVECEVNACNNTIGGTGTAGNSIAFTQTIYAGVRIRDGATNNLIQGNSIFSNGGLGIDLSTYQVSPNDHCDADGGANQQQNFPVITQAFGGTEALIRGMLDSKASSSFVLEFFGNPSCSAQGNGEGRYYLGRKTVTTSAACSASFVVTLPAAIPPGYVVTATATDLSNNTSEFSACLAANPIPPLAIAAQGANQIALSWTNTATGFVLKETISLSPPILWTTVTNSAQSVNGNFVITVTRGAAAKFYELGFE